MAWNKAKSVQERATHFYKNKTSFITLNSLRADPNGTWDAATKGHTDPVFKALTHIFSFLNYYLYADDVEEAIEEAKPRLDTDWRDWANKLQTKIQNRQLLWLSVYMNEFVRQTGGDAAWKAATRKQRREAIGHCFDQAPLMIATKLFCITTTRVSLYQVYGLDQHKVPVARVWRRFIREVFIDLCDKAWVFYLRPRVVVDEFKEHRFMHWKHMTQARKYRNLVDQLGGRGDVSVYSNGLKIHVKSNWFTTGKDKMAKSTKTASKRKKQTGDDGSGGSDSEVPTARKRAVCGKESRA